MSHGHRKSEADDDRKVPLIGVDYALIKKSGEGEDAKAAMSEVTTLVIKDNRSKAVFPIPVPQKGMDPEEYSTRQRLTALEYLGYAEVILKCDQESALNKVIASAQQHRGQGTQTMKENSAVGDSKSNGMVERTNRDVEAQIHTMAAALEEKTGQKLDPGSSVLSWMVLNAGTRRRQFSMGKDGKTPHQRLRGRKSKKQLMEFGKVYTLCH